MRFAFLVLDIVIPCSFKPLGCDSENMDFVFHVDFISERGKE